jgi:NADH dehydrogenase [ubiquinone] 1 alpha subcomplex assembly factor 7
MTPLGRRISALIASQGPMSIAQFMTLALHDPQNGYYATRDPLGAEGDFITAPEISQMFGELIGLWLAQAWHEQGKPARPRLVELGPGRGTLLRDALRAMKLMPEFRDQLDVVLVEMSPALRHMQETVLKDCGVKLRWVESFGSIAADRPLFLVANEFFDALPIRQYVRTARGWCERMVTADADGALGFALSPVAAGGIPADRDSAPMGGVYEASTAGEALAETIAHVIAACGGAALIVDYGYEEPAGFGETLQAVASHNFAGVLDRPGESDLSAHVDFNALAEAAARGGADAWGAVEQGDLLRALGIEERALRLAHGDGGMRNVLNAQVERLTYADQGRMGALFKALAVVPKGAPTPPGF